MINASLSEFSQQCLDIPCQLIMTQSVSYLLLHFLQHNLTAGLRHQLKLDKRLAPPIFHCCANNQCFLFSLSFIFDSDGAYEAEMTFCPPPFTMIVISIIEVLFFVVDIHYKGFMINRGGGGDTIMGPAATIFIYDPSKRIQIWRFVTYMFVHADIMHLVTNLVFQLVLGIILELVHCWWRVGLIYLSGVLAGSIGSSIVNKGIFLCGASGGVYALLTAHVATIIINWREMKYAMIQLFLLLIYFSNDFWSSFYRQWEDPLNNVSYVSHLSGAAAGILVGIGVLRNLSVQSYEKKLWWFAVTFYITLISAGIAYNVAFSKLFYYSHESMEKSSI